MERLNEKKHSKWFDAGLWFCVMALVGAVLTICSLLYSRGENFPKIFFFGTIDTGMDFFHSIEYTKGGVPYELYGTLYPPLANLCFFVLFQMVPEWQYSTWADTFSASVALRTTPADLRVHQPTMMLFILFLIITAALLILVIQSCFKDMKPGKSKLIAFSSLLTHGVLYGYERGNILIIAMMCTLFFLLYYNEENKLLSELALISLAVAAGLKIYPALFGMVLLYNKQYKKAVRTVIYGIAFFVLPIFAFQEGISGLAVFFEKLTNFSTSAKFSTSGYGFDKLVNMLVYVWCQIFGTPVNEEFLLKAIPKWNIIVAGGVLLCGFAMKKQWQQALACCVAMFLYNEQGTYGTMFFLVPLMLFVAQEKQIALVNVVPFLAMTLYVIIIPIINSETAALSYKDLRYQICQIVLFIYVLTQTGIQVASFIKNRRRKQCILQENQDS